MLTAIVENWGENVSKREERHLSGCVYIFACVYMNMEKGEEYIPALTTNAGRWECWGRLFTLSLYVFAMFNLP